MNFINGNTYRIKNQYYPNHALNVYGTNAASTGRNVCLYDDTPPDKMQRWVLKTCGDGFQLCSAVNNSYVLDCSDGSLTNSYKNNAHLCASSSTSATDSKVKFIEVSDDLYKIYLPGTNLYLTAPNINRLNGLPASTIKTATALTGGTGGQSNVYWAAAATSDIAIQKQCWTIEKYSGSSSGGETGGETGGSSDTYTINGKTLPLSDCQINTYWTTDGKPSDKKGSTSKYYHGTQCAGFARYVYAQIWGSDTKGTQLDPEKETLHTVNGNYSDLSSFPIGSRLVCTVRQSFDPNSNKFDKTNASSHQMIILKKTSSAVTLYHANWDEHCKIEIDEWNYTEFYNRFKEIKGASFIPPSAS